MVPNEWKSYQLSELCAKPISYGIVQTGENIEDGIPCLRVVDLSTEKMNPNEMIKTSHEINQAYKKTILEDNEIVMALRGGVGLVRLIDANLVGANITRGLARISAKKGIIHPEYLLWELRSPRFRADLIRRVGGSALQEISLSELRKVNTLVPSSLNEQKKIAQILSTWDQAISATEKMLENSQKQKKALMQQLLTGKKRLLDKGKSYSFITPKGYFQSKLGELPSDWKVELIKNHLWFQEGPGVRNYQFREEGIKLLNGTNIQFNQLKTENTDTYISEEEAFGVYKHFLIDEGDLLIACSGISIDRFDEKIAFVSSSHLPLCMNTSTMRFKTLDSGNVSITYFKYFMQSPYFKNQIRRQATGSAQLNFGPSHVAQCYVVVPHYEEQLKIVSVLSNADNQIDTLQKKLDRLKQEKKALMQQLLTGKKRVKVAA